jgi:hypothetical protein
LQIALVADQYGRNKMLIIASIAIYQPQIP